MAKRERYEATPDGLIQPPAAPDGMVFNPISVSQARAMLFLCTPQRQAELRDAIQAAARE